MRLESLRASMSGTVEVEKVMKLEPHAEYTLLSNLEVSILGTIELFPHNATIEGKNRIQVAIYG